MLKISQRDASMEKLALEVVRASRERRMQMMMRLKRNAKCNKIDYF